MDIGSRVVFFREQAGLSGAALADKIGLDQSQISKIETNKSHPSLKTLMKICEALNVSLGKFFDASADELSPDIRQILNRAKTLTPAQLKALDAFLATMNNQGEIHPLQVTESKGSYRAGLDELVPRKEIDLGTAITKIASIAFERDLSPEERSYLWQRAVDHYGQPPGSANEAAHGPKQPGQIKRKPKN